MGAPTVACPGPVDLHGLLAAVLSSRVLSADARLTRREAVRVARWLAPHSGLAIACSPERLPDPHASAVLARVLVSIYFGRETIKPTATLPATPSATKE